MVARTRKSSRTSALDPSPRHLWLASLGMLVAARRRSLALASVAARRLDDTVAGAREAVRRAESDLLAGVHDVRGRVQPRIDTLSHEVEARLAPIVARLGLVRTPARNVRTPSRRARTVKRTHTRKAGKPAR